MDEIQVATNNSNNSNSHNPRRGDKRRAPYAARACDACRRRKGRCDGRKPCEHCLGRSIECRYSQQPNEATATSSISSSTGQQHQQQSSASASSSSTSHPRPPPQHPPQNPLLGSSARDASSAPPEQDPLGSLSGLVLSLQGQLDTLTAFMKDHQRQQAAASASASLSVTQALLDQNSTIHSLTQQHHERHSSTFSSPARTHDTNGPSPASAVESTDDASQPSVNSANSAIKRTALPFYGPTSPEYSLNAAKMTMAGRTGGGTGQGPGGDGQSSGGGGPQVVMVHRMPSLADEMSSDSDDEGSDGRNGGPRDAEEYEEDEDRCSTLVEDGDRHSIITSSSLDRASKQPVYLSRGLLKFANELSKKETSRLLSVYQEIIGGIHPICDIDALSRQLDRWYGLTPSTPSASGTSNTHNTTSSKDNTTTLASTSTNTRSTPHLTTRAEVANETDQLLMLGLALSTALSAESVSRSELARELYDGFKDTAMSKLITASVTTDKDVVIAMMMGFYEYFNGRLQHAWRLCGLAGRMAMQLGMHSREISQRNESQGRFAELATVTCSLVILDRQWSAAAGLPPNFQLTDFDSAQTGAVAHPYLKAMMQFTLMSNNFNEPVTRVASGETKAVDDDALDVVVFQVEQWRRKTMETARFVHPRQWDLVNPGNGVGKESWMTMLYLRANAVRAILLRPYFLSFSTSGHGPGNNISSNAAAASRIKPALELISDSVETLSILDQRTETYRKQHPQFQHFLASACALLFLVIAYTGQNGRDAGLATELPSHAWYAEMVRKNFTKALSLSASYRGNSSASKRLWKRLMALREPLVKQGILSEEFLRETGGVGAGKGRSVTPGGSASDAGGGDMNKRPATASRGGVSSNVNQIPSRGGNNNGVSRGNGNNVGSSNTHRDNRETNTLVMMDTSDDPAPPSITFRNTNFPSRMNNSMNNNSNSNNNNTSSSSDRRSSSISTARSAPQPDHSMQNTKTPFRIPAPPPVSGHIRANSQPISGLTHTQQQQTPSKPPGNGAAAARNATAAAQALIDLNPGSGGTATTGAFTGSGNATLSSGYNTVQALGHEGSSNEDLTYLDFQRISGNNGGGGGNGGAGRGTLAGTNNHDNGYRNGGGNNHQFQPQQQQHFHQSQNQAQNQFQQPQHYPQGGFGGSGGGGGDLMSTQGDTDMLTGVGGGVAGGQQQGTPGAGGNNAFLGGMVSDFFPVDWPVGEGVYFFSDGAFV